MGDHPLRVGTYQSHQRRYNGIPTDNVGDARGVPRGPPYADADTLCKPRLTLWVGSAEAAADLTTERVTEGPAERVTDGPADLVTE